MDSIIEWFLENKNDLFVGIFVAFVGGVSSYFFNREKIKKTVAISSKTKLYLSEGLSGTFIFNYSNNNGEFTIGSGEHLFRTRWSKASNISIHAYKDGSGIDSICLLKAPVVLKNLSTIEGDFSSRVRSPQIGDAVVWKNTNQKYAITKIVRILDDTRGDTHDELECEYVIFN